MPKLTLILTFFNEGRQLLETLKSFKETANMPVEVILINDASTDSFDYKKTAKDFDAYYIEHSERKGPAISRNEGIEICTTDYFLLLDAHMRVYQSDWSYRIVEELEKNKNILLCCSTLSLNKNGQIIEQNPVGYGAFFNLKNLAVHWVSEYNKVQEDFMEVPCVLGASYACSKKYWNYLKGLDGLLAYGFEEQFISIKVWLSGGRCLVMKSVKCGHIFREESEAPFEISTDEYYLNQLLIVELLYDSEYKQKFIKRLRDLVGNEYVNTWIRKLKVRKEEIIRQKNIIRIFLLVILVL